MSFLYDKMYLKITYFGKTPFKTFFKPTDSTSTPGYNKI